MYCDMEAPVRRRRRPCGCAGGFGGWGWRDYSGPRPGRRASACRRMNGPRERRAGRAPVQPGLPIVAPPPRETAMKHTRSLALATLLLALGATFAAPAMARDHDRRGHDRGQD